MNCWIVVSESVDLRAARFWTIGSLLSLVDVLVVLGNALVIVAVLLHPKLHTTTNHIITSLAGSDLLLGVVVLPFSIFVELTNQLWPFGQVWCQGWLALDVCLCTASIYNLVAISFDRYMAVSRPLKYKYLSSSKTGHHLVLAAWLVAIFISAPPLIVSFIKSLNLPTTTTTGQMQNDNFTSINSSILLYNLTVSDCTCTPMNNESGYIIYSAAGSFWIPLCLILYLNIGIFKHARTAGKLKIRKTPKQSMTSTNLLKKESTVLGNNNCGENTIELRVHRGRTKSQQSELMQNGDCAANGTAAAVRKITNANSLEEDGSPDKGLMLPPLSNGLSHSERNVNHVSTRLPLSQQPSINGQHSNSTCAGRISRKLSRQAATELQCRSTDHLVGTRSPVLTNLTSVRKSRSQPSMTKIDKSSLDNSAAERRVARTILIVIVSFMLCWMPFAVIYVIQAYDVCTMEHGCVPHLMFAVSFWLGYCNSAVNPFIYAAFSRELRAAFKSTLKRLVGCSSAQTMTNRPPVAGRKMTYLESDSTNGRNRHKMTTTQSCVAYHAVVDTITERQYAI